MAQQSGKNVEVSMQAQSGLGSPESGSGGFGFRGTTSQGLQIVPTDIASQEARRDAMTTLGTLGSYIVTAEYRAELSVGSFDLVLAGMLRTAATAAISLTEASNSLGGLTVGTDTLTAAGGSWITEGVLAGQFIKLTDHSEAANNGKWVRVLSVTSSVITCPAGSFTAATEAATWGLTVAKHIVSPATPTETYFTVQEGFQDIGKFRVGTDMKIARISVSLQANGHLLMTVRLVGIDMTAEDAAVLTDPTFTTTGPLVLYDGSLRYGGADVADVTGFEFTLDAGGAGLSVVGKRTTTDVHLSNPRGTGTVSMDVQDFAEIAALKTQANLELFIEAVENETDPADFIGFYIGRGGRRGTSAPFGQDGAMIKTLPFTFGVDNRGTGYAPTMVVISTSA